MTVYELVCVYKTKYTKTCNFETKFKKMPVAVSTHIFISRWTVGTYLFLLFSLSHLHFF